MSSKKALVLAIFMSLSQLSLAKEEKKEPTIIKGAVSYVLDGDRFILDSNDETYMVRMKWIDAPNDGQPLNDDARRFLIDLIENKEVTVMSPNGDVNGCIYGEVIANAQNYNLEMINAGYANITKGAPNEYIKVAMQARTDKKGIWNDDTRVEKGSAYLTTVDYSGQCNYEDEQIIDYKTEESLEEGREHDRYIQTIFILVLGVLLGMGLYKGLEYIDDPRVANEIKRKKKMKNNKSENSEADDEEFEDEK